MGRPAESRAPRPFILSPPVRRGKWRAQRVTVRVEQVEEGVLRLHCRTWRGAAVGYDVSAWVVGGVLIDTGFPRVGREMLQVLQRLELRGAVVTHQHEDHSGGVAALAALGVPLVMHPGCESVARARPWIGLYRQAIWGRPDRLVAPIASFDPAPLEVLALPGHTPDHLAVWDADARILVSGDLFLGVKVRIAHHDERPRRLVASLRTAAALEPRLLLDAHRGPIERPTALLSAKADWLEATIELVSGLHARGVATREITRRVLGREDFVGWVSAGEYSKLSLVRAILEEDHERSPAASATDRSGR
jgi:glyoxylase-like metal-dependent hydrolase (beta-lactamase superfamily II)